MQRTWKQSPKQSVYTFTQEKSRYQKLHGAMGGGRPLRLPLDPPLMGTDSFNNAYQFYFILPPPMKLCFHPCLSVCLLTGLLSYSEILIKFLRHFVDWLHIINRLIG